MKQILIIMLLFWCVSNCSTPRIRYSKEARIKIGVIDTGIARNQSKWLCRKGRVSFKEPFKSPKYGWDRQGHGENVIGLITKGLDPQKFCIVSYKVYDNDKDLALVKDFINAINMAIKAKVKVLNISMGGPSYVKKEYAAIVKALGSGMKINVAAGNDSKNLNKQCDYYPACYIKTLRMSTKKAFSFHVIGAYNLKYSNYGNQIVTNFENGRNVGIPVTSGTSQATAIFTNKMLTNL